MKIILIIFISLYGLWITLRNIANIYATVLYINKKKEFEKLINNVKDVKGVKPQLSYEDKTRNNIEQCARYFFISVGVFVTGLYFVISL